MSDRAAAGPVAETPGVLVERREPEAVFALLADDTRVAILRALGETPRTAVPFGRLRERVGTTDSGRFNYHLKKLLGTFVRKTDEGYKLTYAGRQVLGAMYAGTYTVDATVKPLPVEGSCPECGGSIVASYDDETATLACVDCEDWFGEFPFPPGSLEGYDREELPATFDRWLRHTFEGIIAGFCTVCDGRVEGRLTLPGEVDGDDSDDHRKHDVPRVRYECRRCGSIAEGAARQAALVHPGVRGFFFDHGIDSETPSWVVSGALDDRSETVTGTDPPRVAVTFALNGEQVTAVVGPDATVESVDRAATDATTADRG